MGLRRPLPPPPPPSLPPQLPPPPERCPARRRGWGLGAREIPGGAGPGRGGAEPREAVGARRAMSGEPGTRARPSSHNFAASVGARPGAQGGESGTRALGRSVVGAGRTEA